jgi:hypothetical protein
MELTDMKSMWTEMTQQMEEQQKLTDKLVMDMTRLKYTRKFDKVILTESIGGLICFASLIYIMLNFEKFDTWYLILCGGLAVFVSLVLPVYLIHSLINMRKVKLEKGNFKEALVDFGKAKNRLNIARKSGAVLCFILAIVIVPVCAKLLNDIDVFASDQIDNLYFTIPFMLVLLTVFMIFGFYSYKNITKSAEDLLLELEE